MIAIVDYGVGNLFSLRSSFASLGLEAVVTAQPEELAAADRLVLPGVGAFGDAMEKLAATYPAMKPDQLATLLERAIFAAETWGRIHAQS